MHLYRYTRKMWLNFYCGVYQNAIVFEVFCISLVFPNVLFCFSLFVFCFLFICYLSVFFYKFGEVEGIFCRPCIFRCEGGGLASFERSSLLAEIFSTTLTGCFYKNYQK